MLNILITKLNHYFHPEQEIAKMDAAIQRIAKAKNISLLRTDYLE